MKLYAFCIVPSDASDQNPVAILSAQFDYALHEKLSDAPMPCVSRQIYGGLEGIAVSRSFLPSVRIAKAQNLAIAYGYQIWKSIVMRKALRCISSAVTASVSNVCSPFRT